MAILARIWAFLGRHWLVLAICLGCIAVGHIAGYYLHPKVVTKTTEIIKWQDKIVTNTVTVEKPVIKWQTRTVTVYVPGTNKVEETIKTESGSEALGKTVSSSSQQTVDSTFTQTTSSSTNPEGHWSVRLMAGASVSSGTVVGAGADYRLVGPLTVGAEMTIPLRAPNATQVLLSVGLRL